ncbi:MAG: DUF499 domain-containing protein [bacterium]|nr:DUF499 domain-containing protein [bacterium]
MVSRNAEAVYQDPTTFFANTFPTKGLKSLLTEAFGRITGGHDAPVIRLETAFGGGKTHSLIALYHLAAHAARPVGVENYVDPDLLPDEPIRVAVAVGTVPDLVDGVDHGDFTTYTLWGEIAAQLGQYQSVKQSDQARTAPGMASLAKVFYGGPVIVLLDELARYLEVAAAVKVGDSTLADQTTAFLMALFEYAAEVDNVVVVYSLASSADAFAEQTEMVLEKVEKAGAVKGAAAVGARVDHVISPTGENEIAAIVRHRLFEKVDSTIGEATANSYHFAIVEAVDAGSDLPAHAARPEYAQDLEESYPFHPELLKALNEKVSTIPNFQKTRGALRLLARVVRDLWAKRPTHTWMIHPHHVNLGDDSIAADLTSRLRRPVFKQVIEADIANPMAGAVAHAVQVDHPLTELGKPAYATRMASTVFLHSLVQGMVSGVNPGLVRLALFTPGDDLGLIERQSEALLDQAFYLHFDGARLRFSTEPSLAKVINQHMDLVAKTKAKAELDRRIRTIWKEGAFKPVFFPSEPSAIDDSFGAPRLAVVHYDAAQMTDEAAPPPPIVEGMFGRAGTADGFRTYRNQVVFLVAEKDQVDHAVDEARRYLAVHSIIRDQQRYSQYTKRDRKRLKEGADQFELTLRIAITRLYRHLLYPESGGSSQLAHYALPAQDQGNVKQDQTRVILRVLRELNKVRTSDDQPIAPAYARQKAWPANADRTTPLRLQKEFATRVGLPILLDINLLKETVKLGVIAGVWLYFDPARECAYNKESPTSPLVEITDDVELIVPEAGEGLPICGKEEAGTGPPDETCPVCRNLTSACTCGTPPSGPIAGSPTLPVGALRGEGLPARAFQGIVDLAQDQKVGRLESLEIRAAGEGRELRLDLQAMLLTVPQLPKAERQVDVDATFDMEDDHLRLQFQGGWDRYQNQIAAALGKVAKDAGAAATGYIRLLLTFPVAIEPAGTELQSIRDAFDRNNPGHVEVVAHPAPEATT